jgi:hypothetical protein
MSLKARAAYPEMRDDAFVHIPQNGRLISHGRQ